MKAFITSALGIVALLSFSGCNSTASYTQSYSQAKSKITGVNLDQQKANAVGERFVASFNTLGTAEFVEKASAMYADQLYINDTLSQFSNKNDLIEHFKGMNNRVSNVDVKLLSSTYQGDTAYVHWFMGYDFKMFGHTKTMSSYGISEIKINQNNQIIFQQDYWDPANGLYRKIPLVGGLYQWVLPFKNP